MSEPTEQEIQRAYDIFRELMLPFFNEDGSTREVSKEDMDRVIARL